MAPRIRRSNWCFTLNNYTPEDVDRLSVLTNDIAYIVFGKEVGESGTPHLQGTVCFKVRKSFEQAKAFIGSTAHIESTKFLKQSIEYCKKEGDWSEFGTVPERKQGGGARTDLEDFKDSVKNGITSMSELRELHSEICAKYPR